MSWLVAEFNCMHCVQIRWLYICRKTMCIACMPCPLGCLYTLGTNVNGLHHWRDSVVMVGMQRARDMGKEKVPWCSTPPRLPLLDRIRMFHCQREKSRGEGHSRQAVSLWSAGRGTPPCCPQTLGFSFCSSWGCYHRALILYPVLGLGISLETPSLPQDTTLWSWPQPSKQASFSPKLLNYKTRPPTACTHPNTHSYTLLYTHQV